LPRLPADNELGSVALWDLSSVPGDTPDCQQGALSQTGSKRPGPKDKLLDWLRPAPTYAVRSRASTCLFAGLPRILLFSLSTLQSAGLGSHHPTLVQEQGTQLCSLPSRAPCRMGARGLSSHLAWSCLPQTASLCPCQYSPVHWVPLTSHLRLCSWESLHPQEAKSAGGGSVPSSIGTNSPKLDFPQGLRMWCLYWKVAGSHVLCLRDKGGGSRGVGVGTTTQPAFPYQLVQGSPLSAPASK
jgi:hypothetical protein